jgi:hypothetical protein
MTVTPGIVGAPVKVATWPIQNIGTFLICNGIGHPFSQREQMRIAAAQQSWQGGFARLCTGKLSHHVGKSDMQVTN